MPPHPSHPVANSVTIAKRPSVGPDGENYGFDLGIAKRNIFCDLKEPRPTF
jgi:hypothetical protein